MNSTNATSGGVFFPVTTPVAEELYTKDEIFQILLYVGVVFVGLGILFWCGDIFYQQYFAYPTNVRFLAFKTSVGLAESGKDEASKCSAPSENNVPCGNTAQCLHNNTDSAVVVMSPPPYSSLAAQDTDRDLPPAYQEGTAISLVGLAVITKNKNVYQEISNKVSQ